MPKNKYLYYGILIVAATALLWVGYQVTNITLMILPWTGAVGAMVIIIGLIIEMQKNKAIQAKKRSEPTKLNQAKS